MRINTNVAALNSYNQLKSTQNNLSKSLQRLSSGKRINSAADDAAGLAISEKMKAQTQGLAMAQRNAQDGISMIQTAEGALKESHSILQRMRELAVQSANDTNTTEDRAEIQKEMDQLTEELDRIGNTTEFNTQKLLNGEKEGLREAKDGTVSEELNTSASVSASAGTASSLNASATFTITRTADSGGTLSSGDFSVGDPSGTATLASGAGTVSGFGTDISLTNLGNMEVGDSVTINVESADTGNSDASKALRMQIGANSGQTTLVGISDMRSSALNLRDSAGDALSVTTADDATAAISTIDSALEDVSAERSKLGAVQNRLEHTINNLNTAEENLTAAESRISDVDMAKEMMSFTKNQILSQAGTAMMAQANQLPQGVLQLLG